MALALDAGQLEVAAATSAAAGILPVVLRDWQQRHPGIEVSLLEFPHRRGLDEAVRDGAGDIAVGSLPQSWQGLIEPLGWEEFVFVLAEGDPLLAQAEVDLAALADRRWVHFTTAHGLAEVIDFCCANAGFTPRVAVRTSQVTAAPLFAAAGIGPALVPEHNVPAALMRLARPATSRPIRAVCAFTRGDLTTLTHAFLEALRDYSWRPKPRRALDLG
jgi:DNA-binding transcriptional LysR family regulator